ncbi:NAD(P)-binding protein [Auriculariales sp. MPI-PUGE-AT-0066]|nr:NAD(P)-binding protein [Auriculariales sp. MPI-PUGE-AT-0066]
MSSQVVLVTGGSSGIGLALVQLLLQQGNKVANFVRTKNSELETLSAAHSSNLLIIQGDVTSDSAGNQAVAKTVAHFGRLDSLVLNAASGGPLASLLNSTTKDIVDTYATNVFSVYAFLQAAIPELRKTRGRVVVLSSFVAGGAAGISVYAATKSAVNTLIGSVAKEELDIAFLAVDPGVVDTKMAKEFRDRGGAALDPAFHKHLLNLKNEAKLVQPADVAVNLAFFALRLPHGEKYSGTFITWNSDEAKQLIAAAA